MITILPESTGKNVGFKMDGKPDVDDHKTLFAKVDESIQKYGRIDLVSVMGDFEGWSDKDATTMVFEFGTNEYRHVDKAAFVGDKTKEKEIKNE